MRIGILHPGAMGADLGGALAARHSVLWTGVGRTDVTRERATGAGFVEVAGLADLVRRADVIMSICPPHAAVEVAERIATVRSGGFFYIDANSVAPETMRDIARRFDDGMVVDATVTGAPGAGNTTLWLAGPRSGEAAELFSETRIASRIIGRDIGQASAFKMCAGLRSKVIPAVWATLLDAASAFGQDVEYAVHKHLREIGYDVEREAERVAERAAKVWRWTGEMDESAKTMREVGLPSGFSEAASMTYHRIAARSE